MKQNIDINDLRKMFTEINEDCKKTGESVVPFSDVEYYTDQIMNIYELEYEEAHQLAKQLN